MSDILMSIHPQHVRKIVSGVKNHEFRNYDLPTHTVWVYSTLPEAKIMYKIILGEAAVYPWRNTQRGAGNAEFNREEKTTHAHPIKEVYELETPITLDELREFGVHPPQKYLFIHTDTPLYNAVCSVNLQRRV